MDYKSPKLTVDGIIVDNGKIVFISRKNPPFKDSWALPGGFVEYGEKVEDAIVREVLEETGLETKIKCLFGVYSDPSRDPRGHTVSVVFVLDVVGGALCSGDDAKSVKFFDLDRLPDLAFDHEKIVDDYVKRS